MDNYLRKVVGEYAVDGLDRCTDQYVLMATSGVWGTPGDHRMIRIQSAAPKA